MIDAVLLKPARAQSLTAPQIVAECQARPDCPAWICQALWLLSEGPCVAYTWQEQHWLLSSAYTSLDQTKWVYAICLTASEVQLHRFRCHPLTGDWRNGMPHLPQLPQFLPHARLRHALGLCPLASISHHDIETRLHRAIPAWKRAYVQQTLRAPQILCVAALAPLQQVLVHYQYLLDHWVTQPERYQELKPQLLSVFAEKGDGLYHLQTVPVLNERLWQIQNQATASPTLWRSLWRTFFRFAFQRLKWPTDWIPEFTLPLTTYLDPVAYTHYAIFNFKAYGQQWEWEMGQHKNHAWLNQVSIVNSPLSPGGWPMQYLPLGLATLSPLTLPKEHPVLFPWELFSPIRAYLAEYTGIMRA